MKTPTRIPVSKNFFLDELLPPTLYEKHVNDLAVTILDHRIITGIQFLREEYGKPIYANTWWDLVNKIIKEQGLVEWPEFKHVEAFCAKYGKAGIFFDERGVRDPNTSTGAPKSRHKWEWTKSGVLISRKCDAVDLDFSGINGPQTYEFVEKFLSELYNIGFRRFEDTSITPQWFHMDMKEHKMGKGFQIINRVEQTDFIRLT